MKQKTINALERGDILLMKVDCVHHVAYCTVCSGNFP